MLRQGTTNLKHNKLIYTKGYYKCIHFKVLMMKTAPRVAPETSAAGVMALECGTHKNNGHFHSLTRPYSQNINCTCFLGTRNLP